MLSQHYLTPFSRTHAVAAQAVVAATSIHLSLLGVGVGDGVAAARPESVPLQQRARGRVEAREPLLLTLALGLGRRGRSGGVTGRSGAGRGRSVTPVGRDGGADLVGELLAQFDAELVEAVNAPHEALDGRAVLVQREQRAHLARRQPRQQQHRRRPVAGHDLMRRERGRAARREDLGQTHALGQRVGLCEEVAHELVVVAVRRAGQRAVVLRDGRADKVHRHHAALRCEQKQ